jgi:hypothetical protein
MCTPTSPTSANEEIVDVDVDVDVDGHVRSEGTSQA